jgi:hypothetical protein
MATPVVFALFSKKKRLQMEIWMLKIGLQKLQNAVRLVAHTCNPSA